MRPEFCEFIAENEWVEIKPNFNGEQLQLICGDIGPFEAGVPLSVPLWVAVFLKKKHSCEIILPEWLTLESLGKMIVAENDSPSFSRIPKHFIEMAHTILYYFKDDIVNGDQIKTCVLDVWDRRVAKMRSSTLKFLSEWVELTVTLRLFQANSSHARLDNITFFEVCYAKPPILEAIKNIRDFHTVLNSVRPS
ncbi:unnamed protein product [Enterobius vermicularis]|uniref:GINS complex subunit 2 n=1 Tax=Enterobius vermicularis TaxID=51028 RepID=A0A0N4VP66_ENTVE|nr:unnamed protein product [Enterobius vermicularis]